MGLIAVEMMERIAWDVIPHSVDPWLVAPLDRIIEALIPGLHFMSLTHRSCRRCENGGWVPSSKTHREIYSATASGVKEALESLEVITEQRRLI